MKTPWLARVFTVQGFVFSLWLFSLLGCFFLAFQTSLTEWFLPAPLPISDPSCRRFYDHLFAAKIVDIRIVFGYKDARPAPFVGDRYERIDLLMDLVKPCRDGRQDCGFERDLENSDLLFKKIKTDRRQIKKVQLRLIASSVSPDDRKNRLDPFQKWQSKVARENFFDGVQSSDIVFYNGHSRDGGGPDFEPPRLRKNDHVDYYWYRQHQKGKKELQQRITKTLSKAKVIGLFSCQSEQLRPSGSIANRKLWLTNHKLIFYSEAIEEMKDHLSNLLNQACLKTYFSG